MKAKISLALLSLSLLTLAGCGAKTLPNVVSTDSQGGTTKIGNIEFVYDYTNAEGTCKGISDCHLVETCDRFICTNQPDQYQADSCEVNIDQTASPERLDRQNYNCGCVPNEYKCGWLQK